MSNKNDLWNKVLYKGMNGKDVTFGRFVIGIILIFIAIRILF